MSLENNDMERMFAEGLRDYEVVPPEHVWTNIQKRKRKGLLFFKWKLAAAVLLLFLAGVSSYKLTRNHKNQTIIQTENRHISTDNTNESLTSSAKESNTKSDPSVSDSDSEMPTKSGTKLDITGKDNGSIVLAKKASNPSITPKTNKKSTSGELGSETEQESTEPLIAEVNNSVYLTEPIPAMLSKDHVKLRYMIYPSLIRYVYTSKRLFKKYYNPTKKTGETIGLGYQFSVEFLGGPSYAFRNVKGESSLLRNESEKASLSVQTGVKLNYHFNPTWSVQSGLIIENRNERINYQTTEIQTKLIQTPHQVTVFHPVLPPRTITIIDSSYTDEEVKFNFNTTNKYSTFHIPLVLGYNFTLGRLEYRISAGSLLNIYSNNSANTLKRDGDNIVLVPYTESKKINASMYSGVAIKLPLNTKIDFVSELSYYSNMANRLKDESDLRQRNYSINLSAGLKFNLIK